MDLLQTIIIAIVEGLTEFLPVSSTGHMIITQHLLGVEQGNPFVHAFTFIIQFGAILSVVCIGRSSFPSSLKCGNCTDCLSLVCCQLLL